jgi:hypothetical protein
MLKMLNLIQYQHDDRRQTSNLNPEGLAEGKPETSNSKKE